MYPERWHTKIISQLNQFTKVFENLSNSHLPHSLPFSLHPQISLWLTKIKTKMYRFLWICDRNNLGIIQNISPIIYETSVKPHLCFTKQNQIYLTNLNFYNPILKDAPLPALCLAIYPRAQATASLTPGSKSSKHITSVSSAPQSTIAWASWGECLATARNTKAAAFL